MQSYKYFLTLLLSCLLNIFNASSQGFAGVNNFSKDSYSAGAQNWVARQDDLGKLYIGNRDGMLQFDGLRWHIYYLPNYTTVRALSFDSDTKRIYAAGSEEFGYFSYSPLSFSLKYTSLLDKFEGERPPFSEIWNILSLDNNVWFQADNYMFCFADDKVVSYPISGRISASAIINSHLYIGLEDGRILQFNGNGFKPLNNTTPLAGKKIVALLPFGLNDILVATAFNGLYLYNGNETTQFVTDINSFLIENQLFCATHNGDSYVFGTVNHGAVIVNFKSGKAQYINKDTGLQNNTILNISFDKADNVWLCLDNGLDYVINNTAVTNLINRNNSIGAGYASIVKGNRIYYGTNQGLFSTAYPYTSSPLPISLNRDLQGQIWSLSPVGNGFFIASDAGVYIFDGTSFKKIEGIPGTYKVAVLGRNPDKAIASTYEAFYLLARENGQWKNLGHIEGYNDIGGHFLLDNNDDIWLPHWRKGVYRLRLNDDATKFVDSRIFNHSSGLPSDQNNAVAFVDNNLIFTTEGGFFRMQNKQIIPDENLNKLFWTGAPGIIRQLPDKSIAFIDNYGLSIATKGKNNEYSVSTRDEGMLRGKIIPGFTDLNFISPSEIIISTQDGFSNISNAGDVSHDWVPKPFVSSIYANNDSLVYTSPLLPLEKEEVSLPYDLNSLRFEFAYPDFNMADKVEFSSYLENYDNDWTPFSSQSTREYTRLSNGDYILHLRVRNSSTGEIIESKFHVRIMPPWYFTAIAKLFYFLVGTIIVFLLIRIIKKKIVAAQHRLELKKEKELEELKRRTQQDALVKDYEIANLKAEQLEQDVKHKTQELNNTTINLARKNEILTDIASQISTIQKIAEGDGGNAAIQRQLAKIQSSIEKNISKDDDWKAFTHNFDIVYGDYTKRLIERHPNLSPSDKRLCCYIRMGLSSKEIAPLINISYKSVEMARYRLRKKINLPSEASLTDYLLNI